MKSYKNKETFCDREIDENTHTHIAHVDSSGRIIEILIQWFENRRLS